MFTFHYVMVFISNSYIVTFCTYSIDRSILFHRPVSIGNLWWVPIKCETKRNETKRNQRKRNETKRNQQKRNEAKRNQRNETKSTKWKRNETKPTKAKRNQLKQNEIDWYEENGRIMEGKK